MGTLIRAVLVGAGLLAASWAGMAFAAKRLPPGAAKDLATVLPACLAKGARLAKAETVPLVPMTPEEVRAISHSMTEPVRGTVVVAAGTGLRQGELFGLGSDRVDFMRRELRVDRQLWTPAIRHNDERVRKIVDESLGGSVEDWLRTRAI